MTRSETASLPRRAGRHLARRAGRARRAARPRGRQVRRLARRTRRADRCPARRPRRARDRRAALLPVRDRLLRHRGSAQLPKSTLRARRRGSRPAPAATSRPATACSRSRSRPPRERRTSISASTPRPPTSSTPPPGSTWRRRWRRPGSSRPPAGAGAADALRACDAGAPGGQRPGDDGLRRHARAAARELGDVPRRARARGVQERRRVRRRPTARSASSVRRGVAVEVPDRHRRARAPRHDRRARGTATCSPDRPSGHNRPMADIAIDWTSADVSDGRLTVALQRDNRAKRLDADRRLQAPSIESARR